MQTFWLVLGFALIALALLDAIATTLSTATRAGPLTRVTTQAAWRVALSLHRRRPSHALLTGMGPLFLVMGLVQWLLLLWLGWLAVFSSDPSVLVLSDSEDQASFLDRLYFTGMALFSLGTGDVVAATPGWRSLSVLATATGLFLVTLSLSYFISVVGAATERRVLAAQLHALGRSPQSILTNAWQGTSFSPHFASTLSALGEPIARYAEQHISSHVLHYVHSRHPSRSVIVGLARLDEALTLLDAVPAEVAPDPFVRDLLRDHMTGVLEVVGQAHQSLPSADVPPPPDGRLAQSAGVPVADTAQVARALEGMAGRRRRMAAMVASDGWRWEDV